MRYLRRGLLARAEGPVGGVRTPAGGRLPRVEVADIPVPRIRRSLPRPAGHPEAASQASGGIAGDAARLDRAVGIARRRLQVDGCSCLARRDAAMLATFDRRPAALALSPAIPLWSSEASQEAP
jgi:hypothetical protein